MANIEVTGKSSPVDNLSTRGQEAFRNLQIYQRITEIIGAVSILAAATSYGRQVVNNHFEKGALHPNIGQFGLLGIGTLSLALSRIYNGAAKSLLRSANS